MVHPPHTKILQEWLDYMLQHKMIKKANNKWSEYGID